MKTSTVHAIGFLFFLLAALAWCHPLLADFLMTVPGQDDVWLTVWNHWWMDKALLDLKTNPFYSDFVFYPLGVDLHYHAISPFNSSIAVVLRRLLSPAAAYNILFIAAIALAGYGAYWLTYRYTGRLVPSLIAGYIYAFSPYHWEQVRHLDAFSIHFLPFLWVFLEKARGGDPGARRQRPLLNAFIAGLLFSAMFHTNVYYGLSGMLLVGIIFFCDAAWGARSEPLHARAKRLFTHWGTFAAVVLAGIGPFVFEMFRTSGQPGRFKVPLIVNVHQSLDLLSFITPSYNNPLLRDWFPTMGLYKVFTGWEPIGFLGFSVIGLAALGFLRGSARQKYFLAVVAGIFLILSLGPVLHVAGIVDGPIPMPQALLQFAPVISAARVPARYIAVAMLPIAVLAGLGATSLLDRSRRGRWLVALAIPIIAIEYWNVRLETSRSDPTPYCAALASDGDDFAVMDLPLRVSDDPTEWWMSVDQDRRAWYQCQHGKRLMTGSISHTALTRAHFRYFLDSKLLAPLVAPGAVERPALTREEAIAEMRKLRLKYFVLHHAHYSGRPKEDRDRDRRILTEQWGLPVFYSDKDVEVVKTYD